MVSEAVLGIEPPGDLSFTVIPRVRPGSTRPAELNASEVACAEGLVVVLVYGETRADNRRRNDAGRMHKRTAKREQRGSASEVVRLLSASAIQSSLWVVTPPPAPASLGHRLQTGIDTQNTLSQMPRNLAVTDGETSNLEYRSCYAIESLDTKTGAT